MIDEARELLDRASRLLAPLQFDPSMETERSRIEAGDYALITIFPKLVRAVQREATSVQLEIHGMGEHTRSQFEVGELDTTFWNASSPHSPSADRVQIRTNDMLFA